MHEPDRQFLSRLILDPATEYGWEDLDGFDFSYSYDDERDPFDDRNITAVDDSILDDDFLLEN